MSEVAASSDDRRRLLHALRLSRRFHLYPVYCETPRVAAEMLAEVEHWVAENRPGVEVALVALDFEGLRVGEEAYNARVESALRALVGFGDEPDRRVHVLDASRALSSEKPQWENFFHRFNEVREAVRKHLAAELILVMPAWMEELFSRAAPDVWSIRSSTYRVNAPRTEPEPVAAAADTTAQPLSRRELEDPRALRAEFIREHDRARDALAAGNTAEALGAVRASVRAARTRWEHFPTQLEGLGDLGEALEMEARALDASGDTRGALACVQESAARARELIARDVHRPAWHAALAGRLALEASLHAKLHDADGALHAQQRAVEHARAAHEQEPSMVTARRVVEQSRGLASRYVAHGKPEQARRVLSETLPLLPTVADDALRAEVERQIAALDAKEREPEAQKKREVKLLPPVEGAPTHVTPRLVPYWHEERDAECWRLVLDRTSYPEPESSGQGGCAATMGIFLLLGICTLASAFEGHTDWFMVVLGGIFIVLFLVGAWIQGSEGNKLRWTPRCFLVDAESFSMKLAERTPDGTFHEKDAAVELRHEVIDAFEVVEEGVEPSRHSLHVLMEGASRRYVGTSFSEREDALFVASRLTAAVNHFRQRA